MYQYAILECENAGNLEKKEEWRLNYCETNQSILLPDFGMVKINLFAAVNEAEKIGWELFQVFPDSSTKLLSYGYAIMRKKK